MTDAEAAEVREILKKLIALSGAMRNWPISTIVVQCADVSLTLRELRRLDFLLSGLEAQATAIAYHDLAVTALAEEPA